MSVLIIGGAGYIGSHTVKFFKEKNQEVILVDNLSTGHKEFTKQADYFYELDIRDKKSLDKVFKKHSFKAVIHFAANSLVAESMENPIKYYDNNVYGMLCLLEVMKENSVKNIVFSSSAATYGTPSRIPIEEEDLCNPTNPYGESKLAMEKMIHWFESAYGFKYISLRYFNAAGADKDGYLGESHSPETHLIPIVIQVAMKERDYISIFGSDYDTPDGTALRDYIHVLDLAEAHYLSYQYLVRNKGKSQILNLGTSKPLSVLDIISEVEKISGKNINKVFSDRRPGDPAVLIASNKKAKNLLGWEPKYSDIEEIISDAWNWHNKNKTP